MYVIHVLGVGEGGVDWGPAVLVHRRHRPQLSTGTRLLLRGYVPVTVICLAEPAPPPCIGVHLRGVTSADFVKDDFLVGPVGSESTNELTARVEPITLEEIREVAEAYGGHLGLRGDRPCVLAPDGKRWEALGSPEIPLLDRLPEDERQLVYGLVLGWIRRGFEVP